MIFIATLATVHSLWEVEIKAKNQFDALNKVRTIANDHGKRKELEVLFSVNNLKGVYWTPDYGNESPEISTYEKII
ncbi:hypothetical protein [Guptibacillus spartinae]|uniref:hypothetical protein n=1 Tax=Guptibacillus spartinae TaxID=3025679 RepID=UPI00235F6E08|nr:hypothetical protein [Pseudalkalibacillus spartinae]